MENDCRGATFGDAWPRLAKRITGWVGLGTIVAAVYAFFGGELSFFGVALVFQTPAAEAFGPIVLGILGVLWVTAALH